MAIVALRLGVLPSARAAEYPTLQQTLWGLSFSNPVGLAAGFDKNASALSGLLRQGFGFVEAGTVTPLPQVGNPKPRLFRLSEDEAVINRMGFNNAGLATYVRHLRARPQAGIIGANIGKNKSSDDALADYVTCLRAVYAHADYVTINISSPNTPGLRDLQHGEMLKHLLSGLDAVRHECAREHGKVVPLLLKLAPDLMHEDVESIVRCALEHHMDGLIISNTTITRPDHLRSIYTSETGGLSGRPLFSLSTALLKDIYRITQGSIPLIGVGGIANAEDAYAKIRAGASLVQLYSALVYRGFGLVPEIASGLDQLLQRDGFTSIAQAVGADCR